MPFNHFKVNMSQFLVEVGQILINFPLCMTGLVLKSFLYFFSAYELKPFFNLKMHQQQHVI